MLLFLEVEYINHILYVYLFIYSYIIYIYNIVFCSCSFSLMFYGINSLRPTSGCFLYLVSKGCSVGCARNDNSVSIFCVRLPVAFCIWYQKGVLQNISSMIIRYHFIMLCLPINAGTPKSTVSISFQTIKQRPRVLPPGLY